MRLVRLLRLRGLVVLQADVDLGEERVHVRVA
jgi:hypothetical protein